MSNTNPTIVIVPGAWLPAEVFEAFADQLRTYGYPSQAVSLPSVGGTETPLPGLKDDVKAVRDVVTKLSDEARDIVLLCHSSGGLVGSCAVCVFVDPSRCNLVIWRWHSRSRWN